MERYRSSNIRPFFLTVIGITALLIVPTTLFLFGNNVRLQRGGGGLVVGKLVNITYTSSSTSSSSTTTIASRANSLPLQQQQSQQQQQQQHKSDGNFAADAAFSLMHDDTPPQESTTAATASRANSHSLQQQQSQQVQQEEKQKSVGNFDAPQDTTTTTKVAANEAASSVAMVEEEQEGEEDGDGFEDTTTTNGNSNPKQAQKQQSKPTRQKQQEHTQQQKQRQKQQQKEQKPKPGNLKLPVCKSGTEVLSNGNFTGNSMTWIPFDCSYKPPSRNVLSKCLQNKHVTFLGDSVMYRVFGKSLNLVGSLGGGGRRKLRRSSSSSSCKVIKSYNSGRGRNNNNGIDDLHQYLNLTPPAEKPHLQLCQNPPRYDRKGNELSWFGRTSCTGCGPQINECKVPNTNTNPPPQTATTIMEMIPVEFASDVEVATQQYKTTQESIINTYFHYNTSSPDIIIVSAGHHDAFMWGHPLQDRCHEGTLQRYRENLERYANLLVQYATWRQQQLQQQHPSSSSSSSSSPVVQIIWMTMSLVPPKYQPWQWKDKTDNDLHRKMNQAATEVMTQYGIRVVDVWELSSNQFTVEHLNNEGIHIDGKNRLYYKVVADAIFYDLCRQKQEEEEEDHNQDVSR